MKVIPKLQRIEVLDERFYTLDNETYYPSVTTVLEAYPKGYAFQEWLKRNGDKADEILYEAGTQGSNVHNAIESFLKGNEIFFISPTGEALFSLKEWQMICKFMEFFKSVEKVEFIELNMVSPTKKIGGTLDLICTINGKRWLIDYKTSNGIYKTYELQLAIYKEMFEEIMKLPIDNYGVLWLNAATKTDKPPLQGIGWQIKDFTDDHKKNLKLWEYTRGLWDEENPNYKPKNLEYPSSFKLHI